MYRRVPILALTATLATTGTTALTQDAQGFVVRGMGALSCAALVNAIQGEQRDAAVARLVAWMSGYVSHANRAAADVNDVLPYSNIDGLAKVVARVCANNQGAQVEAVTASVIATFAPLRLAQLEDAVELRRGEATVSIRPSVLKGVQQRLIELDLLPKETADGVYGDQTADALANFQGQTNLVVTSLPDAWTVFLLQAAK